MKQYLEVVQQVMEHGSWQKNRTKYRTLSVPGLYMRMDLQKGFPAVTTKKLAFKSAVGEILGYVRGYSSAADFRALGCKAWDQNANENADWLKNPYRLGDDSLGSVYGVQWRGMNAYKMIDPGSEQGRIQIRDAESKGFRSLGFLSKEEDEEQSGKVLLYKSVDQLRNCLDTIMKNPGDRRIIFHAWNVAELDQMALPSCPTLFQFVVDQEKLEFSLNVFIRSSDVALGLPWNAVEGAILAELVGRLTGYKPRWLSMMLGDAHIYENALEMLQEQLKRDPLPLPKLAITDRVPEYGKTGVYAPEWLNLVEPSDFSLVGYEHHPALTTDMAI